MARKATRRARMARSVQIGATLRARPADLRVEVMRLAEELPPDCLAEAFRRIRALLAGRR